MKIRGGKKPNQAMALMEVVMATGIIAITSAALIGAFNSGFFIMKLVRENQRATQILMEKVETIRLYSWTQVKNPGFIPSFFSDRFDPQAEQNAKGVQYYGFIRVGDVPFNTGYSTNMQQIQITLVWSTDNKISHTRSATTFIAKDGIQNYVY